MLAKTLLTLGLAHLALAKTVVYNWDIMWMRAAPDGFERNVIGINNQWPCPAIEVDLGDKIVVHMNNMLGNQSTSLHWHGLHQNGTQEMDGASGITQCPVPPGSSFTYEFMADRPGTYWYHSHTMGQYPDGLFGPLLIHDPNPPFHFDEHLTITFMDWYHQEMPELIHAYQSREGIAADGTPNPVGSLINLSKNAKIHVKPNTTYYVHIICPGNYPGHAFIFDQHPMTTVEIDGVYVEPVEITGGDQNARVAPGQRQGVLLHTKPTADKNYALLTIMDANMLFINKGIRPPPKDYPMNCTAHLVYDETKPMPPPPDVHKLGNAFFFDDLDYVPINGEPLLGPVDHQIIMETSSANVSGIARFAMNDKTYLHQKVPTLYSALTLPKEYVSNPLVYGQVNPIIIKHNDVVEIVINNLNSNLHPWHLHGHQFQILERTLPNSGPWNGTYNNNHHPVPAVRDTFMLQNNAFGIIRFRANNPGVWSIHCHIEFHTVSGFIATLIEAPEILQEQHKKRTGTARNVPRNHEQACKKFPMLIAGNAGGNMKDPLNLKDANTCVNANEWGAIYPPKPAICVPGVVST